MDTVLFNFHDVVLILTAFECLLFAAILRGNTGKQSTPSALFLIGFLLCHSVIPLHELISWGKQFKYWALSISPNLFFAGNFAYFLDGPLLYFFIRALLFKDFKLKRLDALHLAPLFIYASYITISFYSLEYDARVSLIENQSLVYSAPQICFDAASRYLRIGYGVLALLMIFNYGLRLRDTFANVNEHNLKWLTVMVSSVLILFLSEALLQSVKLAYLIRDKFNSEILILIGTSGYHLTFIVLNILIYLRFTRFQSVEKVSESPFSSSYASDSDAEDQALAERINTLMTEEKVYARANLSVDSLANELEIPPKKLSQVIKLQYRSNFYDFVNGYRIEAAKIMLASKENSKKNIADIYTEVGFNSKSVFNTFFKRTLGMTPSAYRKSSST